MKDNLGVLLPVSSLPGNHGIGDFGKEAYHFIDWLRKNHYHYWQILPLNPLGPGDSPYMSTCSKAIDERYISLDLLVEEGLLEEAPEFEKDSPLVNFYEVDEYKKKLLYQAYRKFISLHPSVLSSFRKKNPWAEEFAVFQVFKWKNGGAPWNEWNAYERTYFRVHQHAPRKEKDRVDFVLFLQYTARKQWDALRKYARKKHVMIIADMPFYVGWDSVDCWAHTDLFRFDQNDQQVEVGGVPPDYFSEDGQLWGSPIYDFVRMKEDGYSWLIDRIASLAATCDYLRIDHFRAFDTYYVIPAGRKDAKVGEWRNGPGKDFFDLLYEKHPDIRLIAEDLGLLFPSVHELRDHYRLPGMFVAEFALLDYNQWPDTTKVVYTGTHDNDTFRSWFDSLTKAEKAVLRDRIGYEGKYLYRALMKAVANLPSFITVFPLQDLLELKSEYRLNTPGTTGGNNWRFRLSDDSYKKRVKFVFR